jgi:hypothetical protein
MKCAFLVQPCPSSCCSTTSTSLSSIISTTLDSTKPRAGWRIDPSRCRLQFSNFSLQIGRILCAELHRQVLKEEWLRATSHHVDDLFPLRVRGIVQREAGKRMLAGDEQNCSRNVDSTSRSLISMTRYVTRCSQQVGKN